MIVAGPLLLWATVLIYPRSQVEHTNKRSLKSRKQPKHIKSTGSLVTWRLYLSTVVWIATIITLWSKVTHTTVSDTQIAKAMDRASLLFKEGRYVEALSRFWVIEIPECFPNRRAQKYHNIGLIQLKLEKPKEAETALQKAVSYDPKDMDAYYLLANIAYNSKQYSKAKQYLQDAESQMQNGTCLPETFRLLNTELEKFQSVR